MRSAEITARDKPPNQMELQTTGEDPWVSAQLPSESQAVRALARPACGFGEGASG